MRGKLTESQVRAIRASTLSNEFLSERYGVSASMIKLIKLRYRYKHVV